MIANEIPPQFSTEFLLILMTAVGAKMHGMVFGFRVAWGYPVSVELETFQTTTGSCQTRLGLMTRYVMTACVIMERCPVHAAGGAPCTWPLVTRAAPLGSARSLPDESAQSERERRFGRQRPAADNH